MFQLTGRLDEMAVNVRHALLNSFRTKQKFINNISFYFIFVDGRMNPYCTRTANTWTRNFMDL